MLAFAFRQSTPNGPLVLCYHQRSSELLSLTIFRQAPIFWGRNSSGFDFAPGGCEWGEKTMPF